MENKTNHSCPYLGRKNDPTTTFNYPTHNNFCHRAQGKPSPKLTHQQLTCLTADHVVCPVYTNTSKGKMPITIRHRSWRIKLLPKYLTWAILTLALCLIVFFILKNYEQVSAKFSSYLVPAKIQSQQMSQTNDPIMPPTATIHAETHQPTATSTATIPATPTPTQTPQPTASPTITSEPALLDLNTPIGRDVKFIIQRVNPGETLLQFASRYNTTVTAIRSVNFNLPSVLYVDWMLIIPMGITDTSNLPAFRAVEVQEEEINITAFAEQQAVALEDLYLYNDIQPGRMLTAGEWLLVPRE